METPTGCTPAVTTSHQDLLNLSSPPPPRSLPRRAVNSNRISSSVSKVKSAIWKRSHLFDPAGSGNLLLYLDWICCRRSPGLKDDPPPRPPQILLASGMQFFSHAGKTEGISRVYLCKSGSKLFKCSSKALK